MGWQLSSRWRIALSLGAAITAASLTGCQPPSALLVSSAGESLSGQQTKSFSLSAPHTGFLKIVLVQIGLDCRLVIARNNASPLGTYESSTGRYGEERVAIPIKEGDKVVVMVESTQRAELSGRFDLAVEFSPRASDAEQVFSSASRVNPRMDRSLRVSQFENAAKLFTKLNRVNEAGLSLLAAASLSDESGFDSIETQRLANLAVGKFARVGAKLLVAESMVVGVLAELNSPTFDKRRSGTISRVLNYAHAYYKSFDDATGVATIASRRGQLSLQLGNREFARQYWETATQQCETASDKLCQARSLQSLGLLERDAGRNEESLATLHRALNLFDRSDNLWLFATIKDNIGYTHRMQGNYDAALLSHKSARAAYAEDGLCNWVSGSQYAIGYSLLGIGDVSEAIQAYRRVLDANCSANVDDAKLLVAAAMAESEQIAIESIKLLCEGAARIQPTTRVARFNMLWTAWDLGNLARLGGNTDGAITCHELAISLAPTDNTRIGATIELAEDLLAVGKVRNAYTQVKSTLAYINEQPYAISDYYRSRSLLIAGRIAAELGEVSDAREHLGTALELFKSASDYDGCFLTWKNLGEIAANQHAAQAYFTSANLALSSIRTGSLDPSYRASLFALRRDMYAGWVNALLLDERNSLTSKQPRSARELQDSLAVSELSRARLLSDFELGFEMHSEGDQREVDQCKPKETLHSPNKMSADRNKRLLTKTVHPSFNDNPKVQAKRLATYQKDLAASTAIVEYLLGERASFAWVVTRKSVSVARLPGAAAIRAAVGDATRSVAQNAIVTGPPSELAKLYELVVRPIESSILGMDLVIVADDTLHQVSFAALWDARSEKYLVEKHTISYIPSINSVFSRSHTRRQHAEPLTMLIVGDPVYDQADAAARCGLVTDAPFTKQAQDDTNSRFSRLAGATVEIEQVAEVMRSLNGKVTRLTGCDASRSRLLNESPDRYDFVHIAAHATTDMSVPERSAIHLASFNRQGREMDDSVTMADLLRRKVSAELVVLSGCSTAGGRLFGGEGSLSLSFAILAAGGKKVLSTLWPAADVATAETMHTFYLELLNNKQSAAQALRLAQLRMLTSKRWNSPRYWATYVVIG